MQDFQEVIEDSQLMNAMYDDTPRPIQEWYKASSEEIELYERKANLDSLMSSCLGFYLVWIEHGDRNLIIGE